MKLVYALALLLATLSGFQNCSGAKASDPATPPVTTTSANKLLGLYDLSGVESVRFYYTGGLIAGKAPEVSLTFTGGAPTSADVTVFNTDGSSKCSHVLTLDSSAASQLTAAALALSLASAPQQMAVVSDCSYAHLDIMLMDSSEHIYMFQSPCTLHGELTILDPQNALSGALNQAITANSTCP